MKLGTSCFAGLVVAVGASACGSSASGPDAAIDQPDHGGTLVVTLTTPPADLSTLFFAYQDGSDAWKVAPSPVAGVITIPLVHNKYGFARGCLAPLFLDSPDLRVTHATLDEQAALAMELGQCQAQRAASTSAIQGTITTVAQRTHDLRFGPDRKTVTTGVGETSASYALAAQPSTADLILARSDPTTRTVDRFAVQRNVVVGANPLAENLDFNALAAPDTVAQPVNPAYPTFFSMIYRTTSTVIALLGNKPPYVIATPPAAQRLATDTIDLAVQQQGAGLDDVFVDQVFSSPQAVTLPANLMGPLTVAPIAGSQSLHVGWTPIAVPTASYQANLSSGCGTRCTMYALISFSAGWLGGSSTWDPPDLSGVAGWSPRLLYAPTSVTVTVSANVESGTHATAGYSFVSHTNGVKLGAVRAASPAATPHRLCNPAWERDGRPACMTLPPR